MRHASVQYFLAGFVVANSRLHGANAQRRVICSRRLALRSLRCGSSCHAPLCMAHRLDGL